ncbi:hypothetical protein EV702DRAFT_1059947 [Suillus placidus]|uniref:Uncharacterized protein n=1 Tax=Suillus placidus TaxID=48579 RepID=A0A9P7D870_9AGAM|nr:hypothetical protein EV702DRAFT_1059947 [Suillus placidus]
MSTCKPLESTFGILICLVYFAVSSLSTSTPLLFTSISALSVIHQTRTHFIYNSHIKWGLKQVALRLPLLSALQKSQRPRSQRPLMLRAQP